MKGWICILVVFAFTSVSSLHANGRGEGEDSFIDTTQKEGQMETFERENGWPQIMALGMEVAVYTALPGMLSVEKTVIGADRLPSLIGFRPQAGGGGLRIIFRSRGTNDFITDFIILAHQSLFFQPGAQLMTGMIDPDWFCAATERLLVFHPGAGPAWMTYRDEIKAIDEAVAYVIDQKANTTKMEKEPEIEEPAAVQVMNFSLFPHYAQMEVAVPGTSLPSDEDIVAIAGRNLVRLFLVPDVGEVRQRWIHVPVGVETDAERNARKIIHKELSALANELRGSGGTAGSESLRNRTWERIRDGIEPFFPDEEEFQGISGTVLRLLSLPESLGYSAGFGFDEMFPDYQPKQSPDTVLDYRPQIRDVVESLPLASLSSLDELLSLHEEYGKKADDHPGETIEGNIILGGPDEEYVPSDEELILGEIGERLKAISLTADRDSLRRWCEKPGGRTTGIDIIRFEFWHADVMGSGRFFYVSEPVREYIVFCE